MAESHTPTTPQQLRDKAFIALEDAVQECRFRRPRRSHAVRFALFYLWSCSGADRAPFDEFWRTMGERHSPWSFGTADRALVDIYRALGVPRNEAITQMMWRGRFKEEKEAGWPGHRPG